MMGSQSIMTIRLVLKFLGEQNHVNIVDNYSYEPLSIKMNILKEYTFSGVDRNKTFIFFRSRLIIALCVPTLNFPSFVQTTYELRDDKKENKCEA